VTEKVYNSNCKVCNAIHRKQIETDYVNWLPLAEICARYPSENLNSGNIYRHVDHHDNLYDLRSKNAKRVINRLLEKGLETVDPKDIDVGQLRKLSRDLLETEGQIRKPDTQPIQIGIAIQTQGAERLGVGASRFGFGLTPIQQGSNAPVPALQERSAEYIERPAVAMPAPQHVPSVTTVYVEHSTTHTAQGTTPTYKKQRMTS